MEKIGLLESFWGVEASLGYADAQRGMLAGGAVSNPWARLGCFPGASRHPRDSSGGFLALVFVRFHMFSTVFALYPTFSRDCLIPVLILFNTFPHLLPFPTFSYLFLLLSYLDTLRTFLGVFKHLFILVHTFHHFCSHIPLHFLRTFWDLGTFWDLWRSY